MVVRPPLLEVEVEVGVTLLRVKREQHLNLVTVVQGSQQLLIPLHGLLLAVVLVEFIVATPLAQHPTVAVG
jgi:hypothetical protein